MQDYTRQLAHFAVHHQLNDAPSAIRHEAKRLLVNWIGLPINFCHHDTVERAIAAFAEFSGPRQASLLGRGDKLDIFKAALINCVSSCIADYDDTHLATIIHPTGPIASALLSLCEKEKVRGSAFLHALLLGVETQCRLAAALAVAPAKCDGSWFLTGLTGGIGAAVAAGKLLGLTEQQMIWAMGIAASRASGSRETHGTMAKNLVPAWTAEIGLQAALLAKQNFTAPDFPLEGKRGLGYLYACKTNFPGMVSRLGEYWEITQNAYKPFPCGIVMHGAMTGALDIAQKWHPDPKTIRKVSLMVHPLCLDLTGRRSPRNAVEATFSVYHWVAVSLIDRRISIRQFDDSRVVDPEVLSLRDRVEATVNKEFARDEALVRITLEDGRILEQHVDHALGSIERPMDDSMLTEKLHDLADDVIGKRAADTLAEKCWDIERIPDASAIVNAACVRDGA